MVTSRSVPNVGLVLCLGIVGLFFLAWFCAVGGWFYEVAVVLTSRR